MVAFAPSSEEDRPPIRRLVERSVPLWWLAAALPAAVMVWHGRDLVRNVPMWDEFETVLRFLLAVDRTGNGVGLTESLLGVMNGHCMVTSRLLILGVYALSGQVDFRVLAVLGNASVIGVLLIVAGRISDRPLRALAVVLGSLLLFNLQHYENLFSSYASIDHFLVVLLTTSSLALLTSGRAWALTAALVFAALAVFTLAHGVAVLAAGAGLLAIRREWRRLAWWTGGSIVCAAAFLSVLGSSGAGLAAAKWENAVRIAGYALRLVGGVVSLGDLGVALYLGAGLVIGLLTLTVAGVAAKHPFLWAMAVTAVLSAGIIAFGRFSMPEVSPLSSRYMVQSAVAWWAVVLLGLKSLPRPGRRIGWAVALVLAAAILNVALAERFLPSARQFVKRRIDAARHYDLHRTVEGLKHPIYPKAAEADQILREASAKGIYRLRPRTSPAVELPARREERALLYYIDHIAVSRRNLHVRGWMLPEKASGRVLRPLVMVRQGEEETVFRARAESRPDVVGALGREDAGRCGFYATIPLSALPSGTVQLSLALGSGRVAWYCHTDHRAELPVWEESGETAPVED